MSEWLAIESAPRDGTKILAYGEGIGDGVGAMAWDPSKPKVPEILVIWWGWLDLERNELAGEIDGVPVFRRVSCRVHEGWRPHGFRQFWPTHWMPLPGPPEV